MVFKKHKCAKCFLAKKRCLAKKKDVSYMLRIYFLTHMNNNKLKPQIETTINMTSESNSSRAETGKSSSEPSVTASINIKLNLGDCLEDGGKNDFIHRQQQIVIGIENSPDIYDYYLENDCWYMGCYFVNNPFNKILSIYEFEELFRDVMLKLGFNEEGKKYFKGDSYEQLFIKIEKMMERLIKTLDDTKGGKKWSYKEDNIGRIKLNFQKIDQFLREKSPNPLTRTTLYL